MTEERKFPIGDTILEVKNISLHFLICSVALLYQGTGNILEIFYEYVLDNQEICLHQTNYTV